MASCLSKAVLRNCIVTTLFCFGISVALGRVAGRVEINAANLAWPFVLALGIGLFTGWHTVNKMKRSVLQTLRRELSYVRLARAAKVNGVAFDWQTIDDYAAQLEARGFTRLGEFTTLPRSQILAGVAACFLDSSTSTLVEIQLLQVLKKGAPGTGPNTGGVHFSATTIVGGNIRVSTSDHVMSASHYLTRGDASVVASYPGMPLMQLLEKHARLLSAVCERAGKAASAGLTMPRYVTFLRESRAQACRRIERMSGLEIVRLVDGFNAQPRTNWASTTAKLAALPERPLAELDATAGTGAQPPVIDILQPQEQKHGPADSRTGAAADDVPAPADAQEADVLRGKVESGANWFYWIAGLSIVNIVTSAIGSNWAFALGLGVSAATSEMAKMVYQLHSDSVMLTGALWLASIAATGLFIVCGKIARRPSPAAFTVGITVFALDLLLFLIAAEWIGVLFHAIALYYLWLGLVAARRLKRCNT